MAMVRALIDQPLERDSPHLEVRCTYSLVTDEAGSKYLQLDTYGSSGRKLKEKKSQSIRLAPTAITQLKSVLKRHFD
jgi:hypothetical protein